MNEHDTIPEEEEDDIIKELRRTRWAIYEKAGGTPDAYFQYYVEMGEKRLAAEKAAREAEENAAKSVPKTAVPRPRSGKPGRRRRRVAVF